MAVVFPTPVGVFLGQSAGQPLRPGLPHARGGVSVNHLFLGTDAESSPRPWGCFLPLQLAPVSPLVFPTPVGVFLTINHTNTKE